MGGGFGAIAQRARFERSGRKDGHNVLRDMGDTHGASLRQLCEMDACVERRRCAKRQEGRGRAYLTRASGMLVERAPGRTSCVFCDHGFIPVRKGDRRVEGEEARESMGSVYLGLRVRSQDQTYVRAKWMPAITIT